MCVRVYLCLRLCVCVCVCVQAPKAGGGETRGRANKEETARIRAAEDGDHFAALPKPSKPKVPKADRLPVPGKHHRVRRTPKKAVVVPAGEGDPKLVRLSLSVCVLTRACVCVYSLSVRLFRPTRSCSST